jgi:DNA polymerase V
MQENSCGGETFALRVIGDTMAPEFNDGCIIIIDPSGIVKDGSYVLARQGEEYIFRQLEFGEGMYYLRALQDGHEVIELLDLTAVEGVIIQQGARRRADRKHYN